MSDFGFGEFLLANEYREQVSIVHRVLTLPVNSYRALLKSL